MDKQTIEYYEQNTTEVFSRYESVSSGIADYFQASFPAGSSVLDVGAGSGRDLRCLLALGYKATGIEPCESLRLKGLAAHKELKGRLLSGGLPSLSLAEPADGIVCSAVLMHIPENLLLDSLVALRDSLNVHGRLLISIPSKPRPDLDEDNRDNHGRLFQPIEVGRLILLAERLGFTLINCWENNDSLKREGYEWTTILFKKGSLVGRPLDRIQSILNKDKKVATYKLALLRSLCDIATFDDRVFDWSSQSEVGVPIDLLVERWLFYYWPIIESSVFVPQIQAESTSKPIKFRRSLEALVQFYQPLGGLDVFSINYRSGDFHPKASELLKKTWSNIRSAIISGPVQYADRGKMFRYDKSTKKVYCDSLLWSEFSLTGYWIRDALLLRWAELTAQFSVELKVGDVLTLLLTAPVVEREVKIARSCYIKQQYLHCVWSGQQILSPKKLAVDHALPFSLWGNNDLWNLLPTHHKVNGNKSDKIPTNALLHQQRDLIVHSWGVLAADVPTMFALEFERIIGRPFKGGWEVLLYDYLKRNCEYGIYVRGAQAWGGV